MIQVPFYNPSQKVGESGKIDWFKTGKFVQFQESKWMNDKLDLKQKIEFQIFTLRESLGLHKDYKKIRLASLILCFALLIYILMIALLTPDSSDNTDPNYIDKIIVIYVIFFVVVMTVCVFQIYKLRKMIQMVKLGMIRLNEKIHQEGINVNVAFKPETCFQKYCSDMNRLKCVEVFEYIHY